MENEIRLKASIVVLQEVVAFILAKESAQNNLSLDKLHDRFFSHIEKRYKASELSSDVDKLQRCLSAMEKEFDDLFCLAKNIKDILND